MVCCSDVAAVVATTVVIIALIITLSRRCMDTRRTQHDRHNNSYIRKVLTLCHC